MMMKVKEKVSNRWRCPRSARVCPPFRRRGYHRNYNPVCSSQSCQDKNSDSTLSRVQDWNYRPVSLDSSTWPLPSHMPLFLCTR